MGIALRWVPFAGPSSGAPSSVTSPAHCGGLAAASTVAMAM